MFRASLAVAVVLVPAALVTGQDGVPQGPAPKVLVVTRDPDGRPVVSFRETVAEAVPVEVEVKVGNRIERRTTMRTVLRTTQRRFALDQKNVRFFNGAGKPLDAQDVRKRLKKATPVLVSADGKEVDPFYLQMVRPDTVVVVAPGIVGPRPVAVPLPKDGNPKDVPTPKKQ